jgi:hypothetical protein
MLLRPLAVADTVADAVTPGLAPRAPALPAPPMGLPEVSRPADGLTTPRVATLSPALLTPGKVPWELAEPVRLTRFVARRLAKTALLEPLRDLARAGEPEAVLAHIAAYVVAAGTTFGRGDWNPPADRQGTLVRETDAHTGARLTVACTSRRPLRWAATVELPGLGVLSWEEVSEGQGLGLGYVTVPATVEATFSAARCGPLAGYVATVAGQLIARGSPRLGPWLICATGELTAHDSCAGVGRIELAPTGALQGRCIAADGATAAIAGQVLDPRIVPAPATAPMPERLAA